MKRMLLALALVLGFGASVLLLKPSPAECGGSSCEGLRCIAARSAAYCGQSCFCYQQQRDEEGMCLPKPR